MKVAVIDDERPARRELSYLIRQCAAEAEIFEAGDAEEFLELLREHAFDVCFVDIDLGETNGTTLASMVRAARPEAQIVFATAYREYAVRAFDLGAADYLLKPFDLERVRRSLLRAAHRRSDSGAPSGGAQGLNKLMVNTATGFRVLNASDVVYIETENRACRIHTAEQSYLQNETLNYYENRFHGLGFFRIHKSYLVNLEKVKEIIPMKNGSYSLLMQGGRERPLPVGRVQIKELRRLFEG